MIAPPPFSAALRAALQARSLRPAELATQLGLPRQTVAGWLRDPPHDTLPRPEKWAALEKLAGISPATYRISPPGDARFPAGPQPPALGGESPPKTIEPILIPIHDPVLAADGALTLHDPVGVTPLPPHLAGPGPWRAVRVPATFRHGSAPAGLAAGDLLYCCRLDFRPTAPTPVLIQPGLDPRRVGGWGITAGIDPGGDVIVTPPTGGPAHPHKLTELLRIAAILRLI